MAPYEHLETSATVEFDTEADDVTEESMVEVADGVLTSLLENDIYLADRTSRTPEDQTYLHAWKDNT